MPRERLHVGHPHHALLRRRGAADPLSDRDALARGFAHEGAEEEVLVVRYLNVARRREGVEAGPVDGAQGRRLGAVEVPEEGGGVGEVALFWGNLFR